MRVNGGVVNRAKISSWCRGDPDMLSRELKTRQMYGENHGIDFDSETVVIRATKKRICDPKAERQSEALRQGLESMPRKKRTATSYLSKHKPSKSKSKTKGGYFSKLLEEIDERDNAVKKVMAPQKVDWSSGVRDDLDDGKKEQIKKHLAWMQDMYESDQGEVHVQSSDVQPMHVQSADVLDVSGDVDVFQNLRSRVANLLLTDLPEPVTTELRLIGKDLETLSTGVKQL